MNDIGEIELIDLGSDAKEYLAEVLSYDNWLCGEIVRNRTVESWNYYRSFLPVSRKFAAPFDYKQGLALPRSAARNALDNLYAKIEGRRDTVLIMDDVMADEAVGHSPFGFKHNGEFYHCIDHTCESSTALTQQVWAASVSWHFVCAVVNNPCALTRTEFVTNIETNLSGRIKELIIGAFDGESFILVSD